MSRDSLRDGDLIGSPMDRLRLGSMDGLNTGARVGGGTGLARNSAMAVRSKEESESVSALARACICSSSSRDRVQVTVCVGRDGLRDRMVVDG